MRSSHFTAVRRLRLLDAARGHLGSDANDAITLEQRASEVDGARSEPIASARAAR
jgi:hypothetical protein